jgi:hypothetical protein
VLPTGAIPLEPPIQYAFWWQTVQACSGKSGAMADVTWYYVPDTPALEVNGDSLPGAWYGQKNTIILAGDILDNGQLVRHEMLHALAGSANHDRALFIDACDGVVACNGPCLEETGGPYTPPANAVTIDPSGLQLSVRIDPLNPQPGVQGGWIEIVVMARNPTASPVWVPLTPISQGAPWSNTFGYTFDCATACNTSTGTFYNQIVGSSFGFAPNATRTFVFDRQIPLGTFAVRGAFNGSLTSIVLVTSAL